MSTRHCIIIPRPDGRFARLYGEYRDQAATISAIKTNYPDQAAIDAMISAVAHKAEIFDSLQSAWDYDKDIGFIFVWDNGRWVWNEPQCGPDSLDAVAQYFMAGGPTLTAAEYTAFKEAKRKLGEAIKPKTAEVHYTYADTLNPYGLPGEDCGQVGREFFVRNAPDGEWVHIHDLPEATRKAIEECSPPMCSFVTTPEGLVDPWSRDKETVVTAGAEEFDRLLASMTAGITYSMPLPVGATLATVLNRYGAILKAAESPHPEHVADYNHVRDWMAAKGFGQILDAKQAEKDAA
jgi:hypothetical protein